MSQISLLGRPEAYLLIMEPTEPNYLVAAFERSKAHQSRALRKLGHPAIAYDPDDVRPSQNDGEPPATTNPDDTGTAHSDESRDRA